MSDHIALLHEGGIRHAETHPQQTAIKFRESSLTYLELHQKSNGLADTFVQHGAQPGDRIGICSATSEYLPVAVAGIHKAGCAYVPIDHLAPVSRIFRIMQNTSIKIMVLGEASQALAEKIAAQFPDMRLFVGCAGPMPQQLAWSEIPITANRSNETIVKPDDLAYIIFTSGSTGEPKGIAHTHKSGNAYVQRAIHTYDVKQTDVIANLAPLYFDISTFAYFCSPSVGATTVLVPDEFALFPTNTAALMETEGVTIWYSAPLALQRLLTHSNFYEHDFSALRWVKFGGEVMPVKYLAELMRAIPSARFSNVYGPAEVNQCTFYHLAETPSPDQTVPIGNTWADTTAIVLDEQDKPIENQLGQLAISSPTLMQGYWNNPKLTEQSLYYASDDGDPKNTYYKTGDLVTRDAAGSLIFAGRSDRQVKVRGFRVELDDVEFQTMTMSGVIECAAVMDVSDDAKHHIVLIAQCVPGTRSNELRNHLAGYLPRYAQPHIIKISTQPLPRNASGKIDRLSLVSAR